MLTYKMCRLAAFVDVSLVNRNALNVNLSLTTAGKAGGTRGRTFP